MSKKKQKEEKEQEEHKFKYRIYCRCANCLAVWSYIMESEEDLDLFTQPAIKIDKKNKCIDKKCNGADRTQIFAFDDLNECNIDFIEMTGFGVVKYF